jgi:hypothetical protein
VRFVVYGRHTKVAVDGAASGGGRVDVATRGTRRSGSRGAGGVGRAGLRCSIVCRVGLESRVRFISGGSVHAL